jgi:hypothetical protein
LRGFDDERVKAPVHVGITHVVAGF